MARKLRVQYDTGWSDANGFHPYGSSATLPHEAALLSSEDPAIWHRLC